MKTKNCIYCHIDKNIIEFSKNSYAKDKLRNVCKECDSKYPRTRSKKIARKDKIFKIVTSQKDKINNICNNYIDLEYKINSNFEKIDINKFGRKYKRCPLCKILKLRDDFNHDSARSDGRGSICKKCSYEKYVQYKNDNKSWWDEYQKQYSIDNKERLTTKKRKRERDRKKNDSIFKIKKLLRFRIHDSVKGKGWYTKSKLYDLIGCSIESLKNHLQQTAFKNGYFDFDINNYNGREYHIDHIIPCAAFNLKCGFHQKMCFNYTNLQILTAHSNLVKNVKVIAA